MQERIILQGGELRIGTTASHRAYQWYVQPNGLETKINLCPHLRPVGNFSPRSDGREGGTRVWTTQYEVLAPFTMKFVCFSSQLGKKAKSASIYIDVDEEAPAIEIYGFGGHGFFKGRGRVNAKLTKVDMATLKSQHGYVVTAPPVKINSGSRLIYW